MPDAEDSPASVQQQEMTDAEDSPASVRQQEMTDAEDSPASVQQQEMPHAEDSPASVRQQEMPHAVCRRLTRSGGSRQLALSIEESLCFSQAVRLLSADAALCL